MEVGLLLTALASACRRSISLQIERHIPAKDGEIRGRRSRWYLIEKIRDESTMVCRVIDNVQKHLCARHAPFAAANERERHCLIQFPLGDPVTPRNVPVVYRLLRLPQLVERWVICRVSGGKTVIAPLEVRLEDPVDHIVVIERVNHVLEQRLPRLDRLALRQSRDSVEYQLIGPRVVAREHAHSTLHRHGIGRSNTDSSPDVCRSELCRTSFRSAAPSPL